jgi:hypothetical protein
MRALDLEVELGEYSSRGEGARELLLQDEDGRFFEIVDVKPSLLGPLVILIRPAITSS